MPAPGSDFEVPSDASEVFSKLLVTEYAYLTPRGEPLCWPVTPYWYPDRRVLAIATGLAYPNKALFAKRNPRIAMLFSDARSSGLESPPQVLVQGTAHVIEDLQANADRYVTELREKFSFARVALNAVTVRLLDFYIPRLWVEMTPRKMVIDGTVVADEIRDRENEPARSRPSGPLTEADSRALEATVKRIPSAVLTTVDPNGYPMPQRVRASWTRGEIDLEASGGWQLPSSGGTLAAALTFHRHSLRGTRFDAYMARGVYEDGRFRPAKLVGFFGNGLVFPFSVIPHIGRLRQRIQRELQERGEPMPRLRIP